MRYAGILLLLAVAFMRSPAQEQAEGPTDAKAQKTYKEALEYLKHRMTQAALEEFKKADKQDGGHCLACQQKMLKYGMELHDWKTAEIAAGEMVAEAQGSSKVAVAHYQLGFAFYEDGLDKHKDDSFIRAHEEMGRALEVAEDFAEAIFLDGQALAHLKQDDAAKAQFQRYIKLRPTNDPKSQRAARYISQPELARARMAPAFAVTTIDGQRVSLDDFKGKVVLLDFWATWCGPCREALPHMKSIAKNFQGQPLVILSVSLDSNEQLWKDFVAKNEMTWLHTRDGGFEGPVSRMFGIQAIPHTFTIDADGVLQDERIGDASIEGKLKKLVGRARELQAADKSSP
jgi:thiol-disulfide isomerase/thioredoxin